MAKIVEEGVGDDREKEKESKVDKEKEKDKEKGGGSKLEGVFRNRDAVRHNQKTDHRCVYHRL